MNNTIKIAGLLSLTVLPISSQAAGYCYGYTCPEEPKPADNCNEQVIQSNLAKLRELNVVSVDGLAPLACYGYCVTKHDERAIQADKCEKAEALAKAVQLLAPLAVPAKP